MGDNRVVLCKVSVVLGSHGVSHIAIAGLNAVFHDWHIIAYIYAFGIAVGSIAALLIVKEDPVYLFEFGRI